MSMGSHSTPGRPRTSRGHGNTKRGKKLRERRVSCWGRAFQPVGNQSVPEDSGHDAAGQPEIFESNGPGSERSPRLGGRGHTGRGHWGDLGGGVDSGGNSEDTELLSHVRLSPGGRRDSRDFKSGERLVGRKTRQNSG